MTDDVDVIIEKMQERIRELEKERAFWSRVARAYARKWVVVKITMRVLGGGWAKRERDVLELRRMINSLVPDTPGDLGKR